MSYDSINMRGGYNSDRIYCMPSKNVVPAMGGVYLMETTVDNTIKHKPVIVISNDNFNKGPYVFVCPLTISQKGDEAITFKTWATGQESNAVIDNLRSIDKARLIEYIGQISKVEQQSLHDCICNLFGINTLQLPDSLKEVVVKPDPDKDKRIDFLEGELRIERGKCKDLQKEVLFRKNQYDELLDKFLNKIHSIRNCEDNSM